MERLPLQHAMRVSTQNTGYCILHFQFIYVWSNKADRCIRRDKNRDFGVYWGVRNETVQNNPVSLRWWSFLRRSLVSLRQKERAAGETNIMLCESRKQSVHFVRSSATISDRSIVRMDFLPSLSLPSPFLSHCVALWVHFLCPLFYTAQCIVASCHSTRLNSLIVVCFSSCTSNERSAVSFISPLPVLERQCISLCLIHQN